MGTSARAGVNVEFRATGVDAVRRNFSLLRGDGELSAREVGRGARQMAGAFAEVAREGALGHASLKEIIKSAGEMVLAFGAGGPIVGAIGLIGLTFFNAFDHARQEIVETRKKALEELETISRGGDALTAGRALQQAYGGDQYALRKPDESLETYFRRRYGYGSARARLSDIGRQRAALNNELIAQGRTTSPA
jgi:hypothetical protein